MPTHPEIRVCRCGCRIRFTVNAGSRKIYLNRKHARIAKENRRKSVTAGVAIA